MSTPTIIIDKLSYILNAENHTATLSECLDKEVKYIAIPETITYKEVVYSVTRLGHLAFNRCSIEQVSIPNSVQYIEDNAFADCVNLVSVTIPDSITRIDEWTFTGCCSLYEYCYSEHYNLNWAWRILRLYSTDRYNYS